MGLPRLNNVAIPAELVAKLTAKPKVVELSHALTAAGLTNEDLVLKHLQQK